MLSQRALKLADLVVEFGDDAHRGASGGRKRGGDRVGATS
jgi:hypothetical protein